MVSDRVVIHEDDRVYVEFSACYSIERFFEHICETDFGKAFKRVLQTEAGNGEKNRSDASLVPLIWPDYIEDENPNGKVSYPSWFYKGHRNANKARRVYCKQAVEENFRKELERVNHIFSKLYENLRERERSALEEQIRKFLEQKEFTNVPTNVESDIANVRTKGFFEEIDEFCAKERYKSIYVPLSKRFMDRYRNNPVDAVSRLFIMLMEGSYGFQNVSLILPSILESQTDDLQYSEDLYNCYLYAKDSNDRKSIENEAKEAYLSNRRTTEICYILAKCRDSHLLTSVLCTGTYQEKKITFYKQCIEAGKKREESERNRNIPIKKNYQVLAGEASYALFLIFLDDSEADLAEKYFEIALNYKNPDACALYGDCYFGESEEDVYRSTILLAEEKLQWDMVQNYSEAIRYYEMSGSGYALYQKALCMIASNDIKYSGDIISTLLEADIKGYFPAHLKLKEYREDYITEKIPKSKRKVVTYRKKCVLCSTDTENLKFAATLPFTEGWEVFINSGYKRNDDITEYISEIEKKGGKITEMSGRNFTDELSGHKFWVSSEESGIEKEAVSEIIIVNFCRDINERIGYISKLFESVEAEIVRMKRNGTDPFALCESLLLCTELEEEMSTLHLDRLERDLGEYYIPLACNCYCKAVSRELLMKQPVISEKSIQAAEKQVCILGSSPCIVQIIKDMVSLYIDTENRGLRILVIDKDCEKIKARLYSESAALVLDKKKLCRTILEFCSVGLQSPEFYDVLYGQGDNPLCGYLENCNYYVCAAEDEMLNVRIGKLLRENSIRKYIGEDNPCKIAVLCNGSNIMKDVDGYAISDINKLYYKWYEGFHLTAIGNSDAYHSYGYMTDNWLDRWAMSVHFSYYGDGDKHIILNDYYSREYNRDSSCVAAMFFVYRFISAGVVSDDNWNYERFLFELERGKLLQAYDRYIMNPDNLEEHARLGHKSWVKYMMSRNWEFADENVIRKSIQHGNGSVGHQIYNAKLHAYICEWDELGHVPGEKTYIFLSKLEYECKMIMDIARECYSEDEKLPYCFTEGYLNLKSIVEVIAELKDQAKCHYSKQMGTDIAEKLDKLKESCNLSDRYGVRVHELLDVYRKELAGIKDDEATGCQLKIGKIKEELLGETMMGSIKDRDRNIVLITTQCIKRAREMKRNAREEERA